MAATSIVATAVAAASAAVVAIRNVALFHYACNLPLHRGAHTKCAYVAHCIWPRAVAFVAVALWFIFISVCI